jgi:uncharacterized protein YbaP (TraB family)
MRRLTRLLLALAVIAGFPAAASAATPNFLWKITSPQGRAIYLVGSVHLLSPDYYPLAPAFDEAFAASDLLVEELDMAEMLDPVGQMKMLSRGRLPAGQSLDQQLKPDTVALVSRALNAMGLPFEPLKQFKIWMLAITMQATAWEKAGFDQRLGLDLHFYERAKAQGKPVQGLETLDFQLSRFDGMSNEVQERLLVETIKELDSTKETFTKMAEAWRTGDVAAVEQQVMSELQTEPEMYNRLLVERNRTWLPTITALFSRPQPALVVVGAAHLVGKDGLLEGLRNLGYIVTQQ